jgi:hypothetical protein
MDQNDASVFDELGLPEPLRAARRCAKPRMMAPVDAAILVYLGFLAATFCAVATAPRHPAGSPVTSCHFVADGNACVPDFA